MAKSKTSAAGALERRGWMLWWVTFAVVLALTAAVPLLYLPLLEATGTAWAADGGAAGGYTYVVGFAGLVLLFSLFTALRQRDINRMRVALANEEREKEAVRSRLSELSTLFQMSTTLNLQMPLDVILEIIVRRVVSTLKGQQASIMIFDADNGVLETRASYGLEAEFARHARAKLGEGIAGWVAQQNQAVLLAEKAPDDRFGRHYKRDRHITSALSLPIRVGERCIGVLNVNRINFPVPFEEHHRDLLQMFAEHVGAVVDRAQTMERLGTRTRELEEDNVRLNEMNRLKDVFLSTATHELKTPLTAVIGYAELLSDNADVLEETQKGEFLKRLRGEAARLLGLINDILDLSRLECGKLALHRRRLTLDSLVRDAVQTTRGFASKVGVAIEESYEEGLPELSIDEVKMRQVFVNLLGNAVKFSPRGGVVQVSVRTSESDALIEVSDRGPGIQPEEATTIFELFGQGLLGAETNQPGLGIGLHLVKRLSELHGGHVGVNSRPGAGSTFWVRLPLALADVPIATESDEVASRQAA